MDEAVGSADAKVDDFGDKSATAKLGADADSVTEAVTAADAEVDEFGSKDVKARAGLDSSGLDEGVADDNAKLDELGSRSVTAKANLDSSGFSLPGGGLGALIGGGSIGVGALLPALPGALAGATAAAGTLGAAFAGVGKALSAYQAQSAAATTSTKSMASSQTSAANQIRTAQQAVSQAETQQAHDAVTSAEAIKTAQQGVAQAETQAAHDAITSAESIKNAQQGVAQATQQAAQSQISAEEQLAQAQYAEQQAQESLTQARQQAILTLQQLTNASDDAALSVQQDQLNVQQAQATQAQVDASSTSTALQRAQAALAVKEAEQQLKEAIENRTNSSKAAQTADKEGVAGNPAVLAAEHALAQSKQAVGDAQRALAQAEEQGAQAIAKAEQNLADAIRSASWQRISDAQNVAKAQQNLSDTSRNASWQQQADAKNVSNAQYGLKAAYAAAATAATGSSSTGQQAAQALAKAMGALTPAGKRVVGMLEGMLGEWSKLQKIAQAAVLPGVVTFLQGVKSILPEVNTEVGKMGSIFSSAFSAIGKTLESSGFQKELSQLFAEGNQFIKILGPALGTMTADFIKMGAESGPAVTGLAKGLAGIADGIGALFKGLAPFASAAGSILKTLGDAVGDIGAPLAKVIGTLLQAIAPLLSGALPLFKSLLDQIARVVVAAGPGLTAIGKTLGQMLTALTPLVQPLGTLVVQMVKLLDAAITPLLPVLPQLIPPMVQLMESGFKPMSALLVTLTPLITDLAKVLAVLISDGLTPLMGVIADVVGFIANVEAAGISWITNLSDVQDAVSALASFLSTTWNAIASTVSSVWDGITSYFTGWWSTLSGAFTTALSKVEGILSGAWTTVAGDVKTAWDKITSYFSGWWSDLRGAWNTATSKVEGILSGAWTSVLGTAKTIFGKVMSFFSGFWGDLHKGFDTAVSKVKTAWDKIETTMQTPIKWVITNVYDKLIVRFWNDIAGPVGLPKLKTLAAGGIIPGYAPGHDSVPALLSPGEGVLVPEAVRALGPQTIHAINAQYGRGRSGMMGAFAGGGIAGDASPSSGGGGGGGWISDIGGAVSGVWDNLGGTLKHEIGSLEHDLRAGLALPMKAIGKLIASTASHVPGTAGIAEAARKMPVTLWDKATSWVIGHTSPGAGGTGKYTGSYGSGVAQWKPDVLKVLSMLHEPASLAGQVLYQMMTESGGNPNAINLCVPLTTVILTKRGWLKHSDVVAGDETIGYNQETGRSEWTVITAVHHYDDAPLMRLGNSRWHATTTPNHRWLNLPRQNKPKAKVEGEECPLCEWPNSPAPAPLLTSCPECGLTPERPAGLAIHRARKHGVSSPRSQGKRPERIRRRGNTTAGGLRIHLAKAHGIRGEKQQTEYATEATWITTEAIRNYDRLLLAAPADTAAALDITVQEAALLGWIAGDGHIERGGRGRRSATIGQVKPKMVEKLKALMSDVPHSLYVAQPRLTRMGRLPSGPTHIFRLTPGYWEDLLARAGHPKHDAARQVLAMSTEQRAAWLEAMIDAEGSTVMKPGYSKPQVSLTQTLGPVHDAIVLAVYLAGHRPRVLEHTRDHETWSDSDSIHLNTPVITGAFLDREDAGQGDVWCVSTQLGSWTAEEDGHVFLTGNSDSNAAAGDPSRGLLQTIMTTFERYRSASLPNDIYNPEANIYAAVNYAIHTYGRSLMRDGQGLGSGHGYDSGGWLDPGMTLAVNNTGSPEAILTGDQWDSISGIAQGGGAASLERRLDRIARILERSPAITAGGLSDALNGMGRGALQRGSHSVR